MKKNNQLFMLFFCLVLALRLSAQETSEKIDLGNDVLPPPANYTNYYFDIVSLDSAHASSGRELFVYNRRGNDYVKESMEVPSGEVFHLYVIGSPNADEIAFPKAIYQYPKLRTLFIGGLNLAELPNDLGQRFADLEYLDLQSMPISKLPDSVVGLKYLSTLNLAGTKIPKKEVDAIKSKVPAKCLVISPK
jgi:hypothetical protein